MKYENLLKSLTKEVKGIADDSRNVKKDFLFVAIKGLTVDGHKFISQAIENGAKIVVGEENLKIKNVLYIKVPDSRKVLGELASAWYGNPSSKLKIIGVTGTDGKTTTANLIYWTLNSTGNKTGLVSTVSAKIGSKEYDTGFHVTNPQPLELHKFLSQMVKQNCKYAVLEVTSHGLDQERVSGINFDISVLTNITHEHLDYHKTFDNYMKSKAKLFNNSKISILNQSDKSYSVFRNLVYSKVLTYSDKSLSPELLAAANIRFNEKYNIDNTAAAVGVVKLLGVSEEKIAEAIKTFPGVEGRMQEIKNKENIRIFVDFAHTPNSLENLLSSLTKQLPKNKKLISVFGCAGERDAQKRKMMGKIALDNANITIFTAEDPRSEKVEDIIGQIIVGAKKSKSNNKFYVETERGKAIYVAINTYAKKGDFVVISGKGHEKSMAYGGVEYPWSDQEAVKSALNKKIKIININQKAAVIGLGVEGKDLVSYLSKLNYTITVFDQKPKEQLDTLGLPKDIKYVCGENYLKNDFSEFNIIFRSPGVYRYLPAIMKAEKAGVKISSGINLFFEKSPAKIIGVTGTKGKGTTSTLIYQILKKSGKDVYLAGNIGKPPLDLLKTLTKNSWVVLELSSFQLIDMVISPHISVVLNITTDHMDWHKNRDEYLKAKLNIVSHQLKSDFAVINTDYKDPKNFAGNTEAKVLYFSRHKNVKGSFVENRKLYLNINKKVLIGETKNLLLRGEHNWENITAAIAAASLAGATNTSIKETIFSFKGLEHRLELVGEKKGISFYNDSFATGPQPTIAAIESFDEPLTVILGGFDKGLEYGQLAKALAKRKQVTSVILIGDLANKISNDLVKANFLGISINLGKAKMKDIVGKSMEITPTGGVVLLSPAAASFDMFKDYKDRGNQFKEAVRIIK